MSPLDKPIRATIFTDARASTMAPVEKSLREWANAVKRERAPTKAALPWLKLASFGDTRSPKGSLRHDANVTAVTGVEGDYDGEIMPMGEAADLLEKAGVAAMLYETPSHTASAPRWRVLCPLSKDHSPDARKALVARVNGVLGGVLKSESFALSQSFYFGRDESRSTKAPKVVFVEGNYLDKLKRLDAGARGPATSDADADRDDTRSARHYREALQSARADKTYEEHLEVLDADLADYAEEKRGRSTKGEHDWDKAVKHVEKERADVTAKLDEYEEEFTGYMTADEMAAQPRPHDFVEGLLYEEQVSVWYGMPKTAKSFLMLDLCCHVANGTPWAGRDVEQRNVLVLPLEGRGTLIDRVRAWEAHNKAKCPVVFRMKPFDLAKKEDVAELRAYVKANNIGLVVIDTLARATPGTDEDRAKDMGVIVQRVDRIKDAGAHVMIVHHSNKSGSMRGSIAVAGAADLIVRLERTKGEQRLAIVEENRHGADGEVLRFTLEPRRLDMKDARGKPIMSAAVSLEGEWFEDLTATEEPAAPAPMTDEEHALKAIDRDLRILGVVTREQARLLLIKRGWGSEKTPVALKAAMHRVLASLESKGLIEPKASAKH